VQVNLLDQESTDLYLRLGRQEIGYGASRLIGIRDGPNIRRSFDLAHLRLQHKKARIDVFYGKEVFIQPDAFDNESGLFDEDAFNPTVWGAYYRHPLKGEERMFELYYLGFHSNVSGYSDVFGEETRHSFGLRSFGSIGRFKYNTEFIVQTGDIAGNDVFATNLEADWKYLLSKSGWKPMVGLKLDWSSGDKELDDGKIQTFNPMFVNPGLYSLAGVNTPINLTSLHPSLTFFPAKNFSIYIDYAFFYRTRDTDGFYSPPRSLTRDASQGESRHLGDVIGLMASYELNRNISFDMILSYFLAGEFIEESGDSENILLLAPTVTINF
ncbi:MAG: alginate export family protein, partial [Bacteroidota bacterium]